MEVALSFPITEFSDLKKTTTNHTCIIVNASYERIWVWKKKPIVFPTFKMQQVLNIFYDSPVKYIYFLLFRYMITRL